jgi:hypothetical protein
VLNTGDILLTIAGASPVTLEQKPEITGAKGLKITGAGGVTFVQETDIATGIKATNVKVKGAAGTIIDPDDNITLVNGTAITIPADGKIVAGTTETNAITITKATLNAGTGGTFTYASPILPEDKGKLTLGGSTSLTVEAGGSINIEGYGELNVDGTDSSVVLTSAISGPGAKLTGTGKLTAGETEIAGGSGGWEAVAFNPTGNAPLAKNIIIKDAGSNAATITGASDGSTVTSVLKGGASAIITQKGGTSGNSLTLTTVTVDVSEAGSIELIGAASDGAKLALSAATAIVKGSGSGTTSLGTSDFGSLGGLSQSEINIDTLGTKTIIKGGAVAPGISFTEITGGSSAGSIEMTTKDLMLNKDTLLVTQ